MYIPTYPFTHEKRACNVRHLFGPIVPPTPPPVSWHAVLQCHTSCMAVYRRLACCCCCCRRPAMPKKLQNRSGRLRINYTQTTTGRFRKKVAAFLFKQLQLVATRLMFILAVIPIFYQTYLTTAFGLKLTLTNYGVNLVTRHIVTSDISSVTEVCNMLIIYCLWSDYCLWIMRRIEKCSNVKCRVWW